MSARAQARRSAPVVGVRGLAAVEAPHAAERRSPRSAGRARRIGRKRSGCVMGDLNELLFSEWHVAAFSQHQDPNRTSVHARECYYSFGPLGRCSLMISIIRSAVVPVGKKPMYVPLSSTR